MLVLIYLSIGALLLKILGICLIVHSLIQVIALKRDENKVIRRVKRLADTKNIPIVVSDKVIVNIAIISYTFILIVGAILVITF